MNKLDLSQFKNSIGENVEIFCNDFVFCNKFRIDDNVKIFADKVYLGNNANISSNVTIRSLKGDMDLVSIGDESFIGSNVQILVPYFTMGDYSQIFQSSLLSGYKSLTIGHNCWIGQGAILNSAETLKLGNNVRMGGSQIWTHVASGELLEGSNFYNESPVTIEDNVWLMGFGHTISPGVTLARNSVIMSGSVVTKSTEPYKTYSGIPAVDVSEKLPAWKQIDMLDKYNMIKGFVVEFVNLYPQYKNQIYIFQSSKNYKLIEEAIADKKQQIIFVDNIDLEKYLFCENSLFDLTSKRYVKQRTEIEINWLRFSVGFRARFIPINDK